MLIQNLKLLFILTFLTGINLAKAQSSLIGEYKAQTLKFNQTTLQEVFIDHNLILEEDSSFSYQNNEPNEKNCLNVYAGKWLLVNKKIVLNFTGQGEMNLFVSQHKNKILLQSDRNQILFEKDKKPKQKSNDSEPKLKEEEVSVKIRVEKPRKASKEKKRKDPKCPEF